MLLKTCRNTCLHWLIDIYQRTDDAHSKSITGGQEKQRNNLSARIIPVDLTPPCSRWALKTHKSVYVLQDISIAWHYPQFLAPSREEYRTVPALPQGSGQEGTLPGTDTWWASGSCHGAHWLGRHVREGGKRPGTGHRQLVKLAQGAYSILSHAIVAFRRAIFWQEPLVLLLLLFLAVSGSQTANEPRL